MRDTLRRDFQAWLRFEGKGHGDLRRRDRLQKPRVSQRIELLKKDHADREHGHREQRQQRHADKPPSARLLQPGDRQRPDGAEDSTLCIEQQRDDGGGREDEGQARDAARDGNQ